MTPLDAAWQAVLADALMEHGLQPTPDLTSPQSAA